MSPAVEKVMQSALSLTPEERAELLDELTARDDGPDAHALSPEWLAEIQRRSAEFDAGVVETIPWSEVKRRVRERRPSGG